MTCVICQEEISSTETTHVTNCAHRFHDSCWSQYIQHQETNTLCPICKTEQTDMSITLVIASSPTISYDYSIQEEISGENNTHLCACSKNAFVIICLMIILIIISITCVIAILK